MHRAVVLITLLLLLLAIAGVSVAQESGIFASGPTTSAGKPGRIAYSAYDGTNVAIYTIDSGGGARFKVTDKSGSARNPAYSPTGNKIAYSGHDGNDSEIHTIDPGGGDPLKVTDNDSNDSQPDYAPDGKTIAYVGYPPSSQEYDGTNEAIYTIGVNGTGNSSKVVDNASAPSYSPSGKKIAFLGDTPANPTIYTIGVGGGGKVKVTDTGVADSEPSWGISSTTHPLQVWLSMALTGL
jgi:Tol biopolymer transport system component